MLRIKIIRFQVLLFINEEFAFAATGRGISYAGYFHAIVF